MMRYPRPMLDSEFIYLDHAAATPVDEQVRAAMAPYETQLFFNPSSPYKPAWDVRHAFEQARADLAHAIGAKPAEVVITAGATESINLAVGAVNACEGEPGLQGGAHHVVASAIEHSAVLACVQQHPHTLVPVNGNGLIDPRDVRAAIRDDTCLVTIGLANNEIGTIQPLRAISETIQHVRQERLRNGSAVPIYLHTDASQCAGLLDVNVSTLGVDMLTLNAAKIYGPKQVGLLWASRDVRLCPLVVGGGQERGLRSGTENVAGAVGFAQALQMAVSQRKEEAARLSSLRDALQKALLDANPDAVVSGHKKHRLPNLLHISFPGLDAERLVYLLEDQGVYVGTGAACAANKATRSHVLEAIGLADDAADGSLRFSLGRLSTQDNTQRAARIVVDVVRGEYERVGSEHVRMNAESFWDNEPVPPKGLW